MANIPQQGVNFGTKIIQFDPDLFTVKKCKLMFSKYCEIRSRDDEVVRFPINLNETYKEWQKRTLDDRNNSVYAIRPDEVDHPEKFAARAFAEQNPQIAIRDYVELMNSFCQILEIPVELTDDDFDRVKWQPAKKLMAQFCREAGLPAVEYFS